MASGATEVAQPAPAGPSYDKPTGSAPAPRPSRAPNDVRNVLANWGAFAFYAIAGFLLSPFIVRSLGNEAYGTWALLGALVGYLGLLDFGVRGAVTRFMARLHAANDHAGARNFASAGLFLFTVGATIAALGGVALAAAIGHFSVPAALLGPARIAVTLSALSVSVTLIYGVFGGIILARQRFDIGSGIDVLVEAGRILAVILALRAGHGFVALPLIQLASGLLRLGLAVVVSRKLYPEARPSLRGWTGADIRQIFSFSLTSTGIHAANTIIWQLDSLVIGWFLPISRLTFFAIAANLTTYARHIMGAIAFTVAPRVSALEGSGAVQDARRYSVVTARIATIFLLPFAVTFMVRGETFVGLWMGAEYARSAGIVLWILSLPLCMDAARGIMASALMGFNKHRLLILPYASEAVLNLTLSIILVRTYGIAGVAWGTSIPRLFVTAVVLPLIYRRALDIPIGDFWIQTWLRPGLAMVPFALGLLAVERMVPTSSLAAFFAQIIALLPLVAIGAWFIGLGSLERELARKLVPRLARLR